MPRFLRKLQASEIAKNANLSFLGMNQDVFGILPLNEACAGYVSFYRGSIINDVFVRALEKGAIIFSSINVSVSEFGTILISDHPEEDFCNFIEYALSQGLLVNGASNDSLEKMITVASNQRLDGGAIVFPFVELGKNCFLKPLSVIGAAGFGVFRGRDSNYRHFPHVGGVILGENVEIGTASTVASGTLSPTRINKNSKIDDHVHIAHNVRIGENVVICAGVIIGGGAKIGDNVWIGMGSVIRDGVTVSDDIVLGMGSLVTKSINRSGLYMGQPARFIRDEA